MMMEYMGKDFKTVNIPGYSNYMISKDGDIFSIERNRIIKHVVDEYGTHKIRLQTDKHCESHKFRVCDVLLKTWNIVVDKREFPNLIEEDTEYLNRVNSLKVGSTVYAIGNPGGSALFGTFTDGKVSAIGRSITSSIGYDMVCIQHNAAISPGNSGGALVNEFGQVIGINSSKIAATEFEGISFSIPITQAQDVINKIMLYGYVPGRPRLGISYVANDSSEISGIYSMAVQMMDLPSGSLVIYSIDDESDLTNTDVQPGDMITAVNGKKLDTADVLLETIEKSAVGDELELSIFRIESDYSTKEFKVKVKLIEENSRNNQKEEPTTREILR